MTTKSSDFFEAMPKKECGKCGDKKFVIFFNKDRRQKDGFGRNCRKCQKIYSDSYYAQHGLKTL